MLLAALLSCNSNKKPLPSLHETFSKDDKLPFGGYVAYNQLRQLYSRNVVQTEKDKFEKSWQNIYNNTSDTAALYVCITPRLILSAGDISSMLDYVNTGNTLFISSEDISKELLDTLGCAYENADKELNDWFSLRNTTIGMLPQLPVDSSRYGYFFIPFKNYFSKYDSTYTRPLGVNEKGQANFILVFYGKGKFYIHTEPRALGNYFLLQKNNYRYMQDMFAFAPSTAEHVFWDDYYNKHNYIDDGHSAFGFILKYPQLAWAFWLVIALALAFILFNGKRKQRIIPVQSPLKNTSAIFAETIGRLYFKKKDNKDMADKMIMYFFEYIRNHFFLNTNSINDEFITSLSRRSSVPEEMTAALFATINNIQDEATTTDQQLLSLNSQIENFYKTKI